MVAPNLVNYHPDNKYTHIPSQVKAINIDGPPQNRAFVQAAAEHLAQLQAMAPHMGEAEMNALFTILGTTPHCSDQTI